jgi:hypothetical protein
MRVPDDALGEDWVHQLQPLLLVTLQIAEKRRNIFFLKREKKSELSIKQTTKRKKNKYS